MAECKRCGSDQVVKSGTIRGKQRYICKQCKYHFVEGDQREKSSTAVLKALCTIFQAFNAKQYRLIGNYLKRDATLIYRWMNEKSRKYNRRGNTEALEFYTTDGLFDELKRDGLAKGGPMMMVDNIIDDLYIAVIVQRREKQ